MNQRFKEHNYKDGKVEKDLCENGYAVIIPYPLSTPAKHFVFTTFTEVVNCLANKFGLLSTGDSVELVLHEDEIGPL